MFVVSEPLVKNHEGVCHYLNVATTEDAIVEDQSLGDKVR